MFYFAALAFLMMVPSPLLAILSAWIVFKTCVKSADRNIWFARF
jgi:hypothetical protein